MFVPHTLPNMLPKDISISVAKLVVNVWVGLQLLECTCAGLTSMRAHHAALGRDLETDEPEVKEEKFMKVMENTEGILQNLVIRAFRNSWLRYET